MKLRNKILGFMLPLILVPFLLTAFAVYYFLIRANEIRKEEETSKVIIGTLANLRKELASAQRDLALLSSVPALVDFLKDPQTEEKKRSARTAVRLFFDQNPYYLQLSLVNRGGDEVIKFSRLPKNLAPPSPKAEKYFLRTFISGTAQSAVEEIGKGRFVTMITDGIEDEEYLGTVVLTLNVETFERALRPLLASHRLSAFLFDDRGKVFASSVAGIEEEACRRSMDLVGAANEILRGPPSSQLSKILTGPVPGCEISIHPAEAFERTVYEPQAGENWFLGVMLPANSGQENRTVQVVFLITMLGVVIAVLYVASNVARRITEPLEELDKATRRIARGELSTEMKTGSIEEVEDLARTYREMTRDLKEYQERLVQSAKLATIGELASELSHEIQNRISGISLWLQYLDSEVAGSDPKREYVDEMKKSLEGFMLLLGSLKQYYRKPVLSLARISLDEVIHDTVTMAKDQIENREIRIAVETQGIPELTADREMIKSVVLNILLNAIDAVDDGGTITIATRSDRKSIVIEVSDDGSGIPEDQLTRVFYPFFSTKASGSGLGLAVASNLVAAHGGSIEAESESGSGSKFRVFLPLDEQSEAGGADGEDLTYR